jgi:uncharacterized protein
LTEKRRKHVPLRTCIACQQQRPKREMVRIVRTPEGMIEIDRKGKQAGRGAYVCLAPDCWNVALDVRRLARALHATVMPEDIGSLRVASRTLMEQESPISPRESQT